MKHDFLNITRELTIGLSYENFPFLPSTKFITKVGRLFSDPAGVDGLKVV